jgi:DHA2 family multidrug resistance protein
VRNTQIAHASLGAHVNYANPALQDAGVSSVYNLANGAGMTALNGEITRQASMIAYVDDYWLMMILTLAVIPLLLLVQKPKTGAPAPIDHAALE